MEMPAHAAPLPLAGIRVLDIATFVAAPFAAGVLGEFGAEVIKLEQPGEGDPFRRFGTPSDRPDSTLAWLSEARNKRSITLDLRKPEGAELLKRLVRRVDVLCENFRPGTLEGWGLGYETLAAENPGLVMLRISGYGQTGPYRDRPGFARIAHAMGGLSYLAGLPGGIPVTPGSTSLADYISGLYGAIGVLLALKARDRIGRGQVIDLGLYESIFRVLDELAPAYAKHGIVRERQGAGTAVVCPHSHYRTRDGQWVAIACTSDKMFARLARVMGRPELATAERFGRVEARLARRDEVDGLVAAWTAQLSQAEVMAHCLEGEVPCGPINTIADIFADPHFQARGNLVTLEDPEAGPATIPNVLPRLSETPGRVDRLGPALGEANEAVYCGLLGVADEELARLKAEGVI